MIRAQMHVSPETGKVMQSVDSREDREATPEDYDKALEAVEEMRRIIKEQPESLDLLTKVNKVIEPLIGIPGIGVAFLMRASAALGSIKKPWGTKRAWDRSGVLTEDYMAELLDDTEAKLQNLKARGEKLGQNEKKEAV